MANGIKSEILKRLHVRYQMSLSTGKLRPRHQATNHSIDRVTGTKQRSLCIVLATGSMNSKLYTKLQGQDNFPLVLPCHLEYHCTLLSSWEPEGLLSWAILLYPILGPNSVLPGLLRMPCYMLPCVIKT